MKNIVAQCIYNSKLLHKTLLYQTPNKIDIRIIKRDEFKID